MRGPHLSGSVDAPLARGIPVPELKLKRPAQDAVAKTSCFCTFPGDRRGATSVHVDRTWLKTSKRDTEMPQPSCQCS